MQIKKISKLLKKINNLHDNIKDENTPISSIEKDLLKSYVQGLYEAVISDDETEPMTKKSKEPIAKIPSDETKHFTPEVIVEKSHQVKKNIVESTPLKPVTVVETESAADPIQLAEAPKVVEEMIVPVNDVVEDVAKDVAKEVDAEVVTEEVKDSPAVDLNMSDELATLFETIEVKELSSKLANSPIKSIKSKMGINDKLLTIKELFDKDNNSFDEAIAKLDGMSSFEEAKQYLVTECVDRYNWLSDKKFKKALRFVQLIQRRYL